MALHRALGSTTLICSPRGDDAITAAWQAGKAAWPDVVLERDVFAAHVANLEVERFGTDLYLAAACLKGNPVAIDAFEREICRRPRARSWPSTAAPSSSMTSCQQLRTNLFVGEDPADHRTTPGADRCARGSASRPRAPR